MPAVFLGAAASRRWYETRPGGAMVYAYIGQYPRNGGDKPADAKNALYAEEDSERVVDGSEGKA